ncbi:Gldg family protein [Myxococcota bacterium]|nr:Gldg family protein [Myxococcota bacterium]MBU1535391.1 Gldg family protein [Myxococcota bacterium]
MSRSDAPAVFSVLRVLTLLGRDLRLSFASPLIYVVVMAYLILGGALGFNAILDLGYVTFSPYFQIAPYLMLLIAVVISSGQLNRKRDSLDLAVLSPVSVPEILTARFISGLIILLIPLALSWSLPLAITLAGWGHPDYGAFFAGTLGLALLGSGFLALGLCVGAFFKSQTVSFLVAVLIAFVLWVPNQLVPFFGPQGKEILLQISFLYHTEWFAQGLVRGADVAYFLALGLFCLALAGFGLISQRYVRLPPFRRYLHVVIIASLALFIALFFLKFPFRVDLTSEGLFTLDKDSKKYVRTLKRDVKILFFCDSGLPLKLRPYKKEVLVLLEQYRTVSSKIGVSLIDPSADKTGAALAKTYGIVPVEMRSHSGTTSKVSRIHFGIALVKGEKVEIIPEALQAIRGRTLEYEITYRIKRLSEKQQTIYFSTGHHEQEDPLSPKGNQGFSELFKKLKEFNFATHNPDKGPIPDDAAIFVVAGPKRGFTQEGIARLDNYLKKRGPMLLLLDSMKFKWKQFVKGVPMHWVSNDIGLNPWLSTLGFTQNFDMVLSTRAPRVPMGNGKVQTYALIPMISVNRKMDIFPFTLGSLSPVNPLPQGVTLVKTITSDPTSWRHRDVFEENLDWPRTSEKGPFDVGYLIRGDGNGGRFKLFAFADSDFLRDRLMRGSSTNSIFARHLFNMLLGDSSLGHLRFKGRGVEWLKISGSASRRMVQVVAVALPALLIFFVGLMYNLLRRMKRKASTAGGS